MKTKMTEKTSPATDTPANEAPLESWKEIAAYLKRDTRTVRRWEKSERLPVRRHLHQARSSVYAYPSELDAWWATRRPAAEEATPLWRQPAFLLRSVAVLLLALVSVASGPILTTPGAAAQDSAGMAARQVWTGREVDTLGSVSPDGGFLSFVDWVSGDLAIRNVATGENRRLTDNQSWDSPSFKGFALFSKISPDGKRIAYDWLDADSGYEVELRVTGVDGTGDRLLYRNAEVYVMTGAWSPDGKHILAEFSRPDRTNQIALVALADGSAKVLKTTDWRAPGNMSFSPDG
ncbi:MAG: hypothetical protein HY651_02805, partial [Acidobacteria bacterium]|nr:hypothetical protein [Acidobacteriota bacterium]